MLISTLYLLEKFNLFILIFPKLLKKIRCTIQHKNQKIKFLIKLN